MRHLHGAFEQTIFCEVARELQLFADGKRRSGPHANSRLTQVNHGAGDCPPASPELAVPLDDQPDGLPLVAHALTLLSLTKLSKDHAQQPQAMPLQWRSEEHTSELQSQSNLVCRLLLEKKKKTASRL